MTSQCADLVDAVNKGNEVQINVLNVALWHDFFKWWWLTHETSAILKPLVVTYVPPGYWQIHLRRED